MNNPILTLTRTAAAALSACRFISPTNGVPGAGGATLGVTRTSAAAGALVSVDHLGTVMVESGAAVAEGAEIESDAQGRAITKAAGVKVARALQPATAAGQQFLVSLIPN